LKNIWVPLSGQLAQLRKVETIANNVANANTVGFKKDNIVFKEYLTALDKGLTDIDLPSKEWAPDDFYRTQGSQNAKVKIDEIYTIFEQGQLSPTGNKLDLGLNGKGLLEVLTPSGVRYTRKGILNISKDGELVTTEGFKVLSNSEAASIGGAASADFQDPAQRIIKIPTTKGISISLDGDIFSGGQKVSKLSVVEFKDMTLLKKEGNQVFTNVSDKNIIRKDVKTSIHQGFIEQSNVNAISEMSELIKAHRHFENIQKAVQTYDSITAKAVNDIAKF
jgi:flagellar basal-body rod protein FlgF